MTSPWRGPLILQQPTIGAIYDTRQGEDVILGALKALGATVPADYHAYLQARWQKDLYPAGSPVPFERFFEAALHDGLLRGDRQGRGPCVQGRVRGRRGRARRREPGPRDSN